MPMLKNLSEQQLEKPNLQMSIIMRRSLRENLPALAPNPVTLHLHLKGWCLTPLQLGPIRLPTNQRLSVQLALVICSPRYSKVWPLHGSHLSFPAKCLSCPSILMLRKITNWQRIILFHPGWELCDAGVTAQDQAEGRASTNPASSFPAYCHFPSSPWTLLPATVVPLPYHFWAVPNSQVLL